MNSKIDRFKISRRYHDRMADIAQDMRRLEEDIPVLTVAQFNERKVGLEKLRKALQESWERDAQSRTH